MAARDTRSTHRIEYILYGIAFIGIFVLLSTMAVLSFFGVRFSSPALNAGLYWLAIFLVVIAVALVARGFSEGLRGKKPTPATPARWEIGLALGAGFGWLLVRATIIFLIMGGLLAASGFALSEGRWLIGMSLLTLTGFIIYAVVHEYRKIRQNIQSGMQSELRRINCCPNCEYDLRGSAIRCPECGAAICNENIEI